MKTCIRFITSLRLTVACLIAAILLVFIGTLAQVELGLWATQKKYFHSLFVFWTPNGTNLLVPIFPGGYLLGWILVINLVASHAVRFKITIRNLGVALTHAGVLLLLLGQFVTELVQVESAIRLEEGESASWSESARHTELAITEIVGDQERIVVVPDSVLARREEIGHPDLPFRFRVHAWHDNSEPRLVRDAVPGQFPVTFAPTPLAGRMDQVNIASARIGVLNGDGSEKPVEVSVFLSNKQTRDSLLRWANDSLGRDIAPLLQEVERVTCHGREFSISLRSTRYYNSSAGGEKPCVITLLDFRHDKYEGTSMAKNFSSRIRVLNPNTGEQREALISMNTPFRFGGVTYYQGSFDPRSENVSILHVVRNPVWFSPYFACALVGMGLSFHFVKRLLNSFGRKRSMAQNEATTPPPMTPAAAGAASKRLPMCLIGLATIWTVTELLPPRARDGILEFGKIPVLLDGRVQPIDSVARNALLTISGQSKVAETKMAPVEWLLEAMTRAELADSRKIFRLENIELRALLNNRAGRLGFVSVSDLRPHFTQIEREARQIAAEKEPHQRTGYERDLIHLYESMILYQRIKNTLLPESAPEFAANFETALREFLSSLPAIKQAAHQNRATPDQNNVDLRRAADYFAQFQRMTALSYGAFLPGTEITSGVRWGNVGAEFLDALRSERVREPLWHLAGIVSAWQRNDRETFKVRATEYRRWLGEHGFRGNVAQAAREAWFNQAAIFYKALLLYVAALIGGCVYWLRCSEPIRRGAFYLLLFGFALHSAGLILRMLLHGRPPVTNLYSSAVFVGWGSVALGVLLERVHRSGMAIAVASLVGFVTLIIAHHLSAAGDTLHVLQAVLDTNLWLATHVVIINIGYAAIFLAGSFATVAIVRKRLDKSFSDSQQCAVARTVFGMTCFATLFSFIGTVLGGIWADQSWGRFWGWDPKENGALMIVIWCAVILHGRIGGLLRDRGILIAAVVGNIITSFSWFGVNLLGVGLHTYGFMEGAFKWLATFILFELLAIILALSLRSDSSAGSWLNWSQWFNRSGSGRSRTSPEGEVPPG